MQGRVWRYKAQGCVKDSKFAQATLFAKWPDLAAEWFCQRTCP